MNLYSNEARLAEISDREVLQSICTPKYVCLVGKATHLWLGSQNLL